jgi:hypothetical protein
VDVIGFDDAPQHAEVHCAVGFQVEWLGLNAAKNRRAAGLISLVLRY